MSEPTTPTPLADFKTDTRIVYNLKTDARGYQVNDVVITLNGRPDEDLAVLRDIIVKALNGAPRDLLRRPVYEVREHGDLWTYNVATVSVAIGVKVAIGQRPAAIYRVKGSIQYVPQIERLAKNLVDWLNAPDRQRHHVCPVGLETNLTDGARIQLTKAGRTAGFEVR